MGFTHSLGGGDSSVGIATTLRAGRSGDRIPVGARFSAPVQTGPGAHPTSRTMDTGSFPGVNGRGVVLNPPPHIQCRGLKLGRAIPLPALRTLVVWYRENLYLYHPLTSRKILAYCPRTDDESVLPHPLWLVIFMLQTLHKFRIK